MTIAPSDGCLFGADLEPTQGRDHRAEIVYRELQLGRPLALNRIYLNFLDDIPGLYVRQTCTQGRVAFVDISLANVRGDKVTAGTYDKYLMGCSKKIALWGQPMIISIHQLPEGHFRPSLFVAMWKRIAHYIRYYGKPELALMLHQDSYLESGEKADHYYSDDNDVDWVGAVINTTTEHDTIRANLTSEAAPFAAWAEKKGKPAIVAYGLEGQRKVPSKKQRNLASAATSARRLGLKALVYNNTHPYWWDDTSASLAGIRSSANDPYMRP